jgi:hypothetical protein
MASNRDSCHQSNPDFIEESFKQVFFATGNHFRSERLALAGKTLINKTGVEDSQDLQDKIIKSYSFIY